jgi:DNA-binding PadR family transcriptional regulator
VTNDLSLSDKERVILELLAAHGELYGLQLVDEAKGALKRGTVYVTLARMEDKGYVAVKAPPRREQVPGLPRPRYRATAFGLRVLATFTQMRRALRRPVTA